MFENIIVITAFYSLFEASWHQYLVVRSAVSEVLAQSYYNRGVDDCGVDDRGLTKSGLWANYCIFNSYKNHEIRADIYEIYK